MKQSQDIYRAQHKDRDGDSGLSGGATQHHKMIADEFHKGRRRLIIYAFTSIAFVLTIAILIAQQYIQSQNPNVGGTTDETIEESERASALDLNADPVSFFLTDELRQLGGDTETPAQGEFSVRAVKRAAFHIVQAEIAAQEGRLDDAVEHYQKTEAIYPNLIGIKRNLGLIHLQQKNFVDALEAFRGAAEEGDTEVGVLNNMGVAALHLEDYEQGESALLKALGMQPDYTAAKFNLGVLYLKKKEWDRAAEYYSNYVDAVPDDLRAAHGLAYALIKSGHWDRAALILKQISQVQTDSPPVLFRLAQAQFYTGKDKEAIASLKQGAALLDPRIAASWLTGSEFDMVRDNPEFRALESQLSGTAN